MCKAQCDESLLCFHKINYCIPIFHICINDIHSVTIYQYLLWETSMEATELDKIIPTTECS